MRLLFDGFWQLFNIFLLIKILLWLFKTMQTKKDKPSQHLK